MEEFGKVLFSCWFMKKDSMVYRESLSSANTCDICLYSAFYAANHNLSSTRPITSLKQRVHSSGDLKVTLAVCCGCHWTELNLEPPDEGAPEHCRRGKRRRCWTKEDSTMSVFCLMRKEFGCLILVLSDDQYSNWYKNQTFKFIVITGRATSWQNEAGQRRQRGSSGHPCPSVGLAVLPNDGAHTVKITRITLVQGHPMAW